MKPENIAKIDEMWRKLPALKAEGNKALNAARTETQDMGAVNWGDLSVREVGIKIDEYADMRLYMLIEEASPDASGLYLYVGKFLSERGFGCVEVSTEW